MIQLSDDQLQLVKNILQAHTPKAKTWLFGSRIDSTAKKYSDLDILIKNDQPIPLPTLAKLREAFDESDLPFKVDIVDWHRVTPEFREMVLARCVSIQ